MNVGCPARGLDRDTYLAASSSAALSDLSWLNDMWRAFSRQRKSRCSKNSTQLRLATPEGQAHDHGGLIRAGFRRDYFPYVEVKLRERDQASFALPVSGQ